MRVLVTSGGTSENIDAVRKITNMSSGELGKRIAEKLLDKKVNVIYVSPRKAKKPEKSSNIEFYEANTTQEVYETMENLLKNNKVDVVIHSMAISDYTVDYVSSVSLVADMLYSYEDPERERMIEQLKDPLEKYKIDNKVKISSNESDLIIKLKKTPKIIGKIKEWDPYVKLIGFKLLDSVSKNQLITVAKDLLLKNRCDYVLANDLDDIKENGKHKAYLVGEHGVIEKYQTKDEIAEGLSSLI